MNRDVSHFKRVVVYRIGSLGDTLVALPAFHLVRRKFPDAHITLLTNFPVNAKAAPMEAILKNTNLYNETMRYPVSLRNFGELYALWRSLKDGRFDCLVYLVAPKGGVFTSIRDYLFFRSCGVRKVIGVPFSRASLESRRIPGADLYTSTTSMTLNRLRGFGRVDIKEPQWWDLRLAPAETAEAEMLLRSHGVTGPFLAACAGTKIQPNDWEEHNWNALMVRVTAAYPHLPLVVLGADDERDRSDRMLADWKGPKANLCGRTGPRVSAAVLRGASTMICHDSGPMHLAATMGVPCVAIFSARNPPGVWFPHGDHHTVLYHKTPCWGCGLTMCIEQRKACILSITVDEVFGAVKQQLARKGIVPEPANDGGSC